MSRGLTTRRPLVDVGAMRRFAWLWAHGWRRAAGNWRKTFGRVTYNLNGVEAVRMEQRYLQLMAAKPEGGA